MHFLFSLFIFLTFTQVIVSAICGDYVVDSGEQCDPPGPCCTKHCTFSFKGSVCRPSSGPCDPEETCSGSSASCPANVVSKALQPCRPSVGPCDSPEYCDGVSSSCPADTFVKAGTQCRGGFKFPCVKPEFCDGVSSNCPLVLLNSSNVCRPSRGPCDVPETCSGISVRCPSDLFLSGTSCGNGQTCSGNSYNCPTASPTTSSSPTPSAPPTPTSPPGCGDGKVSAGEQCDPPGPCCTISCRFAQSGTVCRPHSGRCDVAEFCSGSSSVCPLDQIRVAGEVCRSSDPRKFPCDNQEVCNGVSKTCPPDTVKSSGTLCRNVLSFAPCDIPEYCDGVSKTCAADHPAPAGTVCRVPNNSTYPCYQGAVCDGTMKFCPKRVQVPCP